VNRLSIGVQSFQDEALALLGRAHTGAEAQTCIRAARRAGFDNINVDMMFALPRSLDSEHRRNLLRADQNCIAHLAPEHVSVYGLTAELGTLFSAQVERGDLEECDEEEFEEQFMAWHHTLQGLGYTHYEISNYARPGRECRHNLAYWQRQPCYAFGAGAHGFATADFGVRFACDAEVAAYIDAVAKDENPRSEVESFSLEQAMAEWVYLRLRTAEGVDDMEFQSQFGCEFKRVYAAAIHSCGQALRLAAGRWSFSPEAWLLYNHHVKNFLSPP
jgi:oxygen-independent coproporphyrinogen-3 oxidase